MHVRELCVCQSHMCMMTSGVSRVGLKGGFQSHKFQGLVQVGASKGVNRAEGKI